LVDLRRSYCVLHQCRFFETQCTSSTSTNYQVQQHCLSLYGRHTCFTVSRDVNETEA